MSFYILKTIGNITNRGIFFLLFAFVRLCVQVRRNVGWKFFPHFNR